jgi:hypothetical protein
VAARGNKVAATSGRLGSYRLTAHPDVPDFRDWSYEPPLVELRRSIAPPRRLRVLDQGTEGACTGFGLAAVINLLGARAGRRLRASPAMLYEMAKHYDEWRGGAYEGSSCRGAIKGWYHMGVCTESVWPADSEHRELTLERARDARNTTIGAYYRLGARISDYHAALNEAGAVFCSALVHGGWDDIDARRALIPWDGDAETQGGHAFAIVGYDARGFLIQNSWGAGWGRGGIALWTYEDWQANVMDAWVFRLALPTPQLWQLPPAPGSDAAKRPARLDLAPARREIAGHFAHLDDGDFCTRGRYWSNLEDVRETAEFLAGRADYRHLLFYAHGGLNSPEDAGRRIAATTRVLKANGIYPFHFMYDTGVMQETADVVRGRAGVALERAGGLTEWSDRLLEDCCRVPGRALWREMKRGARLPFHGERAGTLILHAFLDALWHAGRRDLEIHLAGHSTGAILLAHLLETLELLAPTTRVRTLSLLAPAATLDLFSSHFFPFLAADESDAGIDRMTVYNLPDTLERADQVAGVYRKSLLYLVARSFEEKPEAPLLGLERHVRGLDAPRLEIVYAAQGSEARSRSKTHGGFDNDPATMNDLLHRVLGRPPDVPFDADTLLY